MADQTDKTEEQICQMIHKHFVDLRQRQKQGIDLSSLTDDIAFTITFINDSVMRPVPILRSKMGIIVVKNKKSFQLAINYSILQQQLSFPRVKTIGSLHREGWRDYGDGPEKEAILKPLVGANSVKDWSLLYHPEDSQLGQYIVENHRLVATEENIVKRKQQQQQQQQQSIVLPQLISEENDQNLITSKKSIKQSQSKRKKNIKKEDDKDDKEGSKEVKFPLVSIRYERVFADYEVADYVPNRGSANMKMEIFRCEPMEFRVSDTGVKCGDTKE